MNSRSAHVAVGAGVLQIVVGLIQAVDAGDTIPTLRPVEHVVLGLYALVLLLLAPAYISLAETAARSRRSAQAAAAGMVLLAAGMTATNLHNQDYSWFPPVAALANALWLFGTIALAVSLHRAGRVPLWVSGGVLLTWVGGIPLSQLGGAALAGAYWVAVGVLLSSRTTRNVERTVPSTVDA